VAHKHLTACLLALAALSAACSSDSDEGPDEAQTAALTAARARSDSIRQARAADTTGQPVQVALAGAAAQPVADEKSVLRESFAYGGGARDPFASLIDLKATGPELSNLQLVGIYLDVASADNSVAVLREKDSGKRYKLHTGDQLGRMQVVEIAAKDVVFRIEDFGYERQETLSLRKQEDMTP
jgi:hypothetical protein